MSLSTPTTKELSDNIIAQLEASLNQTIPLLPKSFNRVLAKTLAAVFIILYKYGGSIFLNMFVATASAKDTVILGVTVNPLTFWGRLILDSNPDPVSATQAELLIDITVENQTGTLDTNTQLINSGNGVTYITIGSILLDAPVVQATIRAVSDQAGGGGAGAIGNLSPGAIVSFANPIANVARDAVVNSQLVTGANGETTEAYRQRIIDRFQKQPQGGAYSDYELWGEEIAGIINVYPYTGNTPGQVDCYVEATVESSGDPDGIPTTAQLQAVLDSINLDQSGLATRRPANALANTIAITRKGFNVEVFGVAADNLAEVQSQIDDAIVEYFLNAEPFLDGLTIPPRLDRLTRSGLIGLVNDIVAAVNGTFTTVTFADASLPAVDLEIYILQQGEKSKLDSPVVFS